MRLLALTNNARVLESLEGRPGIECRSYEDLISVLSRCKELLDEGWKLECDPLAGYISRYIPYHTLLLGYDKERSGSERLRDIAAIDSLIERYVENAEWYAFNLAEQRRREDHMAVDRSIALRVIEIALERAF